MSNSIELEELDHIPTCSYCGRCYETQESIDELVYSRTTATADHYYCADCKREGIDIFTKDDEEDETVSLEEAIDNITAEEFDESMKYSMSVGK